MKLVPGQGDPRVKRDFSLQHLTSKERHDTIRLIDLNVPALFLCPARQVGRRGDYLALCHYSASS